MNTFPFHYPLFLAFLWIPLLFGSTLLLLRLRRQRPTPFADPNLLPRLLPPPSHGRFIFQSLLILLGLTTAWIALARPAWGHQEMKIVRQGRDILVVLDVSRSMLARDVGPNRLARAKADLLDLVNTLAGDRIGLIAFRARAVLLCPLTTDYRFFQSVLDSTSPASAPPGPTDIGHALEKALDHLQHQPTAAGQTVLLLTDGEDLSQRAETAVRKLREAGIPLFTVGYGTPAGDIIPEEDESPLKYQGELVRTRLESQNLKQWAEMTGGAYWPVGAFHANLGELYQSHLRRKTARNGEETIVRRSVERFHWFLLPAFLCLLAAAALSTGRPLLRRITPALLLAFLPLHQPYASPLTNAPPPSPLHRLRKAERLLQEGHPAEAALLYLQAASNLTGRLQSIAEFNAGCAFLEAGQAEEAARIFSRRAFSPDPSQLPFQYNRGCALLHAAAALHGWETNATLAKNRADYLQEAARAFQAAALTETPWKPVSISNNLAFATSNALNASTHAQTLARLERFGTLPPDRLAQHLLEEQRSIGNKLRKASENPLPQKLHQFEEAAQRLSELAELLPLFEHQIARQLPPNADPQTLTRLHQQTTALSHTIRETANRLEHGDSAANEQVAALEKAVYQLWKEVAAFPALLQEDIHVQSNLVSEAQTDPDPIPYPPPSESAHIQREARDLTHLFAERFQSAIPETGLPAPEPENNPADSANPPALTPETRARILELAREAAQLQADAATAWDEKDPPAARALGQEALERLREIEQLLPKDSSPSPQPSSSNNSSDQPNQSDSSDSSNQPDSSDQPNQSNLSDQPPQQPPPADSSEKKPLSEDETRAMLDRALLREKEYLDEKARRVYVEPAYGDRDW